MQPESIAEPARSRGLAKGSRQPAGAFSCQKGQQAESGDYGSVAWARHRGPIGPAGWHEYCIYGVYTEQPCGWALNRGREK